MAEIDTYKTDQRERAKAARRALSAALRAEYDDRICRRISELDAVKNASIVMSYIALPTEVNLASLHNQLSKQGVKLCYPVCHAHGLMQAYSPIDAEHWTYDKCDILAPDPECSELIAPCDIDVVLVPCVAFDVEKNRLGWGAGYYDRYLPRCRSAVKIAVAFDAQRVDSVAADELDVRMDAVATERQLYI